MPRLAGLGLESGLSCGLSRAGLGLARTDLCIGCRSNGRERRGRERGLPPARVAGKMSTWWRRASVVNGGDDSGLLRLSEATTRRGGTRRSGWPPRHLRALPGTVPVRDRRWCRRRRARGTVASSNPAAGMLEERWRLRVIPASNLSGLAARLEEEGEGKRGGGHWL